MSNQTISRYFALVPAAGTGARLGADVPKQYLPLQGKPILWHTLTQLGSHRAICQVYVVLSASDVHYDRMTFSDELARPPIALRCGGQTRAQSVLQGLESLAADVRESDWVLVHDAARPCVSHTLIDRMIALLAQDVVGGIAAIAVSDTLKCADTEQRIEATVSRERLWQAQTPQMFRYGMLLKAMRAADMSTITDEASAIESLGLRPRLIEGDPANIKVTYERDLALAESFLKRPTR